MKLCIDCDHNDRDVWHAPLGCMRNSKININLVSGRETMQGNTYCFVERENVALCGPDAKYYKRIPWKFWRPK